MPGCELWLALFFDEAPATHFAQVLSQLASLAIVLTLLAAVWQVRLMAAQLSDAKQSGRMARSLDFCRRWNDLIFYNFRKPIYSYFESPDRKPLEEKLQEDHEFAAVLWYVLNFYEEVGIGYNRKEVDLGIIHSFYLDQVLFLYEHVKGYLEIEQKKTGQKGLWREFTTMAKEMQKQGKA